MNKWLVIGGVALLVLILSKRAGAADVNSYAYISNPDNWERLSYYLPGSGVML